MLVEQHNTDLTLADLSQTCVVLVSRSKLLFSVFSFRFIWFPDYPVLNGDSRRPYIVFLLHNILWFVQVFFIDTPVMYNDRKRLK